jgi:hypothetical protein
MAVRPSELKLILTLFNQEIQSAACYFTHKGTTKLGLLTLSGVIDLAVAGLPTGRNGDLLEIVRSGDAMLERIRAVAKSDAAVIPVKDVKLRAPIYKPSKIVGIGLNYIDHCRDDGSSGTGAVCKISKLNRRSRR